MKTVNLPESLKPQIFFIRISTETNAAGIYRAKLLPEQKILLNPDNPDEFIDGNTALNVQFSREERKQNIPGALFAVSNITAVVRENSGVEYISHYSTSIKSPTSTATSKKYDQCKYWTIKGKNVNADARVLKLYEQFEKFGLARLPEEEVKAPKPVKTKKTVVNISSLSIIDSLLVKHSMPTIDDNGFYVDPANWKEILFSVNRKKNTLLLGPTGSGKTEIIDYISKSFGKTVEHFDMAGKSADPIATLVGVHRIKAGQSVFDPARFVQKIQQADSDINFDEINRANVMANNVLFPLLDKRRQLEMDIATGEDLRVVKVNPELCFFATANLGSAYTGTNDLDRALLGRFASTQIQYPPSKVMELLLVNRTGVGKNEAKFIAKIAEQSHVKLNEGSLGDCICMRSLLECGEMIADGFELKEGITKVINGIFKDIDDKRTMMDLLMAA